MSQRNIKAVLILLLAIASALTATPPTTSTSPASVSFNNVDMASLLQSLNMTQSDLQQMQN